MKSIISCSTSISLFYTCIQNMRMTIYYSNILLLSFVKSFRHIVVIVCYIVWWYFKHFLTAWWYLISPLTVIYLAKGFLMKFKCDSGMPDLLQCMQLSNLLSILSSSIPCSVIQLLEKWIHLVYPPLCWEFWWH